MPHDLADQDYYECPKWKYVLLRVGNGVGTDVTVKTEEVTGTVDDLTTGLRPWLLAYLRNGFHDHGWYVGCLVAADKAGFYDTYCSLTMQDVLWFWDVECAPVSS